jgi:hypothetical protein
LRHRQASRSAAPPGAWSAMQRCALSSNAHAMAPIYQRRFCVVERDGSPSTVWDRNSCAHLPCLALQAPLVGGPAPDFTATAVFDQEFVDTTLSSYKACLLARPFRCCLASI